MTMIWHAQWRLPDPVALLQRAAPSFWSVSAFFLGVCLYQASPAASDRLGGFRELSVVDGLPDNNVEALVQDAHGFLWIGTRSGLVRHEGNRLRALDIGSAHDNALPGSNIMALAADRTGSVWAAIEGHGVVRVDSSLEIGLHLQPTQQGGVLPEADVWSIAQACDGSVWMAHRQGGLTRYMPGTATADHVPQIEARGLDVAGFQMHLEVDDACRLWLVQSNRLVLLDDSESLRFDSVAVRAAGQPLMTSLRAVGPDRYLLQGSKLLRVVEKADGWSVEDAFDAGAVVVDVAGHADGWLSVSTFEGLVRWHPARRVAIPSEPSGGGLGGLEDQELFHLLLDREGGLWINKARSGLTYVPPTAWALERVRSQPTRQASLPMRSVYAVLPAKTADHLWVAGRTEGLHRLDLDNVTTSPVSAVLGHSGLAEFERIHRLAWLEDTLLVASANQVDAFDPRQGTLRRVFSSPALSRGTIRFIQASGADRFWLATLEAGLYQVDLGSMQTRHFGPEREGDDWLPDTAIGAMALDPSGRWWVAAGSHLLSMSREQGGFEARQRLSGGAIRALSWQGEELWAADDRTLTRWRESADGLVQVSARAFEGLVPGGRPFAFYSAGSDLWLLLTSGLLRIEPESGQLSYLGPSLGLDVGEILGYAHAELPDGRLALGGSEGLALFDPNAIEMPSLPPAPIITRVRHGERPLDLEAFDGLAHWQRDLAFEFSSPSFIEPARLQYRTRLMGHEDHWMPVEGRMSRRYRDLAPGRYRFDVQVGRPGGEWSSTSTSMAFRISPPPWRHPLAYLAYGLALALFLGYLVWLWRRAARRKRNYLRVREDRRVAREADRAKSEFLAVMSHEMRTPLHGVLGMLELIERRSSEPEIRELVGTVQGSGRQLKRIVDDALDLARIEADQLTLESAPFELVPAVEQVVELFAPMAAASGLDLRLRCESALPMLAVGDRGRLTQAIGNLLSNAIKFTPSGAVEIELREAPAGTLRVRVTDSGPGISEAGRARLFDKFQPLGEPGDPGYQGSGLGLAITQKLIAAMGGRIDLLRRPLSGACFEIIIPDCLAGGDPVFGSALIRGLRLDSALAAPERRIVHRLARRWALVHRSQQRAASDPGEVLILDSRCAVGIADRRRYACCLYVDSPAAPEPEGSTPSEHLIPVAWPLTEQRLIRALMTWRLERPRHRPVASSTPVL